MPRTTGTYEPSTVAGETVRAFIPAPLPPAAPPLTLDDSMAALVRQAEAAMARLELAGQMIPSVGWFIYAFVRKEAVLSSQIEGTQATLVDLLAQEADGEPGRSADVQEVCNYLDALDFALEQIRREEGLPISLRLLNETHKRLMRGVRGADKSPGEIRRSQNWIGGTRPGNAAFVPAPPHRVGEALSAIEHYIHAEHELPALVRAGLVHVQFETVHPYLDGNGRIGRLLITLLLEHWGLLSQPLLYLSLFLKRHREEYYRRLNAVRAEGDWEGWTAFFLEAVATIAGEAVDAAKALFELTRTDRDKILAAPSATVMALRLVEVLPAHPIVTVMRAAELLDTTRPTAAKAIRVLETAGVIVETTGKRRDRTYQYQAYLDVLKTGTEI